MSERSKILFPTDFSDASKKALPYAVRLGLALESEVHVLHVEVQHELVPDDTDEFPDFYDLLRAARQRTGQTFEALNPKASRVTDTINVERRGLSAGPAILEYAEEIGCELIVMATQGKRMLTRLVMGSVATEVVRNATVPVLTVPKTWTATELPALVGATIDFSESTDPVFEYAAIFSALSSADLDLAHVINIPTSYAVYEAMPELPIDIFEAVEKEATDKIEKKIAEFNIDREKANIKLLRGPVTPSLLTWIHERQPDLVIQGSHGHNALNRFLLGSVAEGLVNRSECPVLTIKS